MHSGPVPKGSSGWLSLIIAILLILPLLILIIIDLSEPGIMNVTPSTRELLLARISE